MNEKRKQAKANLSEAFGMCMVELGYEDTCEVLANLILISTNATKKDSYSFYDVMGTVKVDIDTNPALRGGAKLQ